MILKLTNDEATVLDDLIFRRLSSLEEKNLKDCDCYLRLTEIRRKMHHGLHDIIKDFYDDAIAFNLEAVEDVERVDVEGVDAVDVTLYENDEIVGEHTFVQQGWDVYEDDEKVDISSLGKFFGVR